MAETNRTYPTPIADRADTSQERKRRPKLSRRQKLGLLAVGLAAIPLEQSLYTIGSEIAEDHGEPYSYGQFVKERAQSLVPGNTSERGDELLERAYGLGEDGRWHITKTDETKANVALGAVQMAGFAMTIPVPKRRRKN